MTDSRTIVVGVDGSTAARRALDWAITAAWHRGAAVLAVHAWTMGPAVDFAWRPRRALRRDSVALLKATIRDAARLGAGVELRWSSVEGDAVTALLEAARVAELLVLAAHRGTAPRDRPLGSVAAACLRHAKVPVVVMPAPLVRPGLTGRVEPPSGLAAYSPAFTG